ncbi:MAG: hypothetical protein ACLR2G_13760 [Phascolarctobacterium faecium]
MRDVFVDGTAGGAGIAARQPVKPVLLTIMRMPVCGFTPICRLRMVGDDNGRPLDYMYGSGISASGMNSWLTLGKRSAANFVRPVCM